MYRSTRIRRTLLVATLLAIALGSRSAADPPAILTLPAASGQVGERIQIALDIADADSMQAGQIDIAYDPDRARPLPETLEPGAFGSVPPAAWIASTPADSIFRIVFSTADTTGFVGSGTLALFDVDLLGEGTSPLSFRTIVLERVPNLILPAEGIDGSITVIPVPVEALTWGRIKQRFAGAP